MTRLWISGSPITVQLDKLNELQHFIWKGANHPVDRIANQWRVDIEWWRIRIWRDYFKLATTSGMLVVIYHDLVNDEWYLQRLYD
jgi:hypothetical protein